MNIRHIEEADFRGSEVTIFRAFAKKNRAASEALREEDVVVFVSRGGNQLLFVHGFTSFSGRLASRGAVSIKAEERTAITSTRHRLLSGTWDPLMLRNYLEEVGLRVHGLPRFEDYYRRLSGDAVRRAA